MKLMLGGAVNKKLILWNLFNGKGYKIRSIYSESPSTVEYSISKVMVHFVVSSVDDY